MKGLVCKYCGGNHFNKTEEGYECTYCHAVYEADETTAEKIERQNRPTLLRMILLTSILIFLISFIFIFKSKDSIPTNKSTSLKVANTNSSESEYTVSQLKNPERNVRIAELSLNQKEINLAKASVAEYGGDKTEEFEQRLADAQKEHHVLKKQQPKKPPRNDMILANPDSEFAVTTYYREAGFLAAYGPEFDQYTSKDILQIWGQPDEIITDSQQIQKNLKLEFDEENTPLSYEAIVLREQWEHRKMTWREVRAYIAIIQDNAHAGYSKQFVYEKQGKPNVYFTDDQAGYVTPLLRYVSFTRSPEKYPRAGLGKYPDDFPENYGSDGLYHEK